MFALSILLLDLQLLLESWGEDEEGSEAGGLLSALFLLLGRGDAAPLTFRSASA